MKKILLVFLVLIVVFSAGCGEETPESEETPYIGGPNGLVVNFMPGFPISEFGQDDLIDIKVEITNYGEYQIPDDSLKVKLYGVSPTEFNTLDLDYWVVEGGLFPVEKGINEKGEGGEKIEVEMGQIDYAGILSGFVERTLLAKVCYPYETVASVEACVTSKRIEELGSQDICDYGGEKIEDGFVSSGPVQITSFTEDLRGVSQIAFKIDIQNQGTGDVYSIDSECEEFETALGKLQNKGKIYVELEPESIVCSFSGEQSNAGFITLEDDLKKTLVCTVSSDEEVQYPEGVGIVLKYHYIDTTSTDIKILGNQ